MEEGENARCIYTHVLRRITTQRLLTAQEKSQQLKSNYKEKIKRRHN